jgi:hypothetical protein
MMCGGKDGEMFVSDRRRRKIRRSKSPSSTAFSMNANTNECHYGWF